MSQKRRLPQADRELELKLTVTQAELDALAASPCLDVFDATAPVTQRLRTTYFDTPRQALRKTRMSFRVRKSGGAWRQTVKRDVGVRAGLSNPIEVESELKSSAPKLGAIPDPGLRRRMRRLVGKTKLQPLFETDVTRTTTTVTAADGSKVELALDSAVIKAAKRSKTFAEIELELKSGNPSALFDVAAQVARVTPIKFSDVNKAERGYRLLAGVEEQSARPQKSKPPKITPDQSCGQAFQAICAVNVQEILDNWQAVLLADDPEGPHQLRISLRRLRTVLRAFRPVIDTEAMRVLATDLRDLGRIVGTLRDLDVLIADILRPVSQPPEFNAGFVALKRALCNRQSEQRSSVRHTLMSSRWSNLQLKLALLPTGVGWADAIPVKKKARRKITPLSRKALDACWYDAQSLGERIDTLSIAERHDLRKKLKALRYSMELFAPIFAKRECRRFVRDLKKLQDLFGYLNDAALADQLRRLPPDQSMPKQHFDQAVGFVIGYHTARAQPAWDQARHRWDKLVADGTPWR